jgi:copper oxidase (laccase) domain-containing protein
METLGARRERIAAAIGPVIRQEAYEVGPEFKATFLDQAPGNAAFFRIPPGRTRDHFDLPGYCRRQLQDAGILRIDDLEQCTYRNESLFFSYRRKTHRKEADYGRQIAAIVVT